MPSKAATTPTASRKGFKGFNVSKFQAALPRFKVAKLKAWCRHAFDLLSDKIGNYSAFGHSALAAQQLSAFSHGVAQAALAAQLSALQHSFFSTHSVFGQHSLAHSPLSAFLQQQLIAQNATAAINKIFFIRLKSFNSFKSFRSSRGSKSSKSYISDLENRCKITVKIAYMQKKLYFCGQINVFFYKTIGNG